MARYSKKSQDKVEKSMHEMKHGELKSGSGKKVKSRKQAIAIGLSEARKKGAKVPKKAAAKKGTAKKGAAKKAAPKKAAAKKTSSKKAAAKKTSPRKGAKKTAAKKSGRGPGRPRKS